MKYLVLGSSGQIGSPLCKYLKDQGNQIFEFDIVNNEKEDLRINNNVLLSDYIQESDFVFFLAFDVGGSRYLSKYQHSFDFFDNNVKIMSNTFSALKKHNKPFIFASSQMSNMSYSPYGVAKAIGERYVNTMNGLAVKFWNVYGVEHYLEKAHVITDFIIKAQKTGIIDMMTDGQELRQFLYVEDCSRCLYILSQNFQKLDKIKDYHITSFEWISILDIANIVASQFEDVKIVPAKTKDIVQQDKRNKQNTYILNFWEPKISLEEGIKCIIKKLK
jgi:nucleoside-diphosphate-sugar epimerase